MVRQTAGRDSEDMDGKISYERSLIFPVGAPNDAYAKYFTGRSFLAPLSTSQVTMFNVTFEPKCRNKWHIHHSSSGGGQILICVGGSGFYQEWGCAPRRLNVGDTVNIAPGVKHWHGAAENSWFSHIAVEVPGSDCSAEWLEAVSDEDYAKANETAN